eukprot:CAMPEP_0115390156 /NCGR_PEP_ID=MMETSP0271-20121206/10057_1 /TAXON_ID=71861 /ORGANISM="Scrippsiella trochoidea, Strain CCMP3099" /LENGTH=127 /DNA_ID=CAMNT_0002813691 /DNA_START=193 /DNA_END=576 /DNA_ORIENTATION=-
MILPSLRQIRKKLHTPQPVVSSVCPTPNEIKLPIVAMDQKTTRRSVLISRFASEPPGAADTKRAGPAPATPEVVLALQAAFGTTKPSKLLHSQAEPQQSSTAARIGRRRLARAIAARAQLTGHDHWG